MTPEAAAQTKAQAPRLGKRRRAWNITIDEQKLYPLAEAIELLKKAANVKFDETVELHFHLGINPKQNDQQVRSTVVLPHGTGKSKKVAVIAKGEKVKEAAAAGAGEAGEADLIDKIAKGWMDFDVLVATPDTMKDVAKLGKILGPKELMPNPKTGTVTFELAKIIKEIKGGRVEFRADASGNVHAIIGKVSFDNKKLEENAKILIEAVLNAKPSSVKAAYIRSVTLCSTMGPGIPLALPQKEQ
ncbi:MAG: 50S ribosomal protein L1 [Elusimicrobia bacterium]|nr:50S ribosomal protein L1 [Elusimicrobiota bacterium]